MHETSGLTFRQLRDPETSTYTYLLGDGACGDAILIDPVLSRFDRDVAALETLGFDLKATLETHVHTDHVTGSSALRDRFRSCVVVSAEAGAGCADHYVQDGDVITLGQHNIEVLATPGHTNGCVTYLLRAGPCPMAFTGDALLIRGCGRTDFQEGCPHRLYRSVRDKIFTLPEHTLVYPGHDYEGRTVTTIAEEKHLNPRLNLGLSEDEFVRIMDGLDLADPEIIAVALLSNLRCGAPLS